MHVETVLDLQAADTSVAAREHAARVGTQLYSQAADQAAVARDQAAQALGEGIDRVRRCFFCLIGLPRNRAAMRWQLRTCGAPAVTMIC